MTYFLICVVTKAPYQAWRFRITKKPGGAQCAHQRKSTIKGYIFESKATKKIPRDSWNTGPYLNRVQDQPWSYSGPYRAPKRDLKMFKNFGPSLRLCLPFIHYTLSGPSDMLEHFWVFVEPDHGSEDSPKASWTHQWTL